MSEAQNHEIKSNSGASPFITPSPSNPEWDRLTHKSVIVDFEVGEQGIAIFDIASTQRRSGHAREALKILKRQFGHIHAEGVIEEWPEAIGFWQQMIDEGLTDSATKTDGGTLSPSNGSLSCAPAPWQDETIASNGRSIKENFSNWFEASKVVDESGSPLAVYHGSHKADIEAFDPDFLGSYFTSSQAVAENYSQVKIYSVYLSLKNPLIVDARQNSWDEIKFTGMMKRLAKSCDFNFDGYNDGTIDADTLAKLARSAGHDGLIIKNIYEPDVDVCATEYVAFHPEQIKSATGNSGPYLKESASICDEAAHPTPRRKGPGL